MQSLDILSFSRLGQKLREKYEPSSPSSRTRVLPPHNVHGAVLFVESLSSTRIHAQMSK